MRQLSFTRPRCLSTFTESISPSQLLEGRLQAFYFTPTPSPILEQPTLLLWSETNPHLGLALPRGLERWVPAMQVRRWQTGGHWLHIDHPEELGRELV